MKNRMLAMLNGRSALKNEPGGGVDDGTIAALLVRAPPLLSVPATWRQAPESGQDRSPARDCAACCPTEILRLNRLDAAIFTQYGFNLWISPLTHCGFCLTGHVRSCCTIIGDVQA